MDLSLLQLSLFALLLQALITSAGATRAETLSKAGFLELGLKAKLKHVEEWLEWKETHSKSYDSSLEELERHLIWLSNKRYIDQHNANSHIFGFTLAMNHLGDVVCINDYSRCEILYYILEFYLLDNFI